jgi:hypothetical protein
VTAEGAGADGSPRAPSAWDGGDSDGDGDIGAEGDGNGESDGPGRSTRSLRVRCDGCGPRLVDVSAVRLLGKAGRWEYGFTCPGCSARVRRPADAALRAALRGAGAAELVLRGPGGAPAAPRLPPRPPALPR